MAEAHLGSFRLSRRGERKSQAILLWPLSSESTGDGVLGKHGVGQAEAEEVRCPGQRAVQNGFLQGSLEDLDLLWLLQHVHGEEGCEIAEILAIEIVVRQQ